MCSQNDDPTTYDVVTRAKCMRILWTRGVDLPCNGTSGLESWTDAAGRKWYACRFHVAEMKHRHSPAEVPA